MTYNTRKFLLGQAVAKKITLRLNKCKFTDEPYVSYDQISIAGGVYSSSHTGIVSSLTGIEYFEVWGEIEDLYAQVNDTGEIVKISFTGEFFFNLIERGLFGTVATELVPGYTLAIKHKGEIDGTCYGYSQTCSSPDSYEEGLFKDVVFSTCPLPSGEIYHAGLDFESVKYSSPEINPGETIGSRGKLSFQIYDQKHDDYDLVYYDDRKTNFGTLFGKLFARHPYFSSRQVIYSEGLRDPNTYGEIEWVDRPFIIDSVNLNKGIFSATCLDPLILTEGKKAKMPLSSPAQLTAAVVSGSTTITFGNAPANYFGTTGDVIVRIDSELIRITANGTTSPAIAERGFGNSQIKDHEINATVQNCIRIVDEHVIDAIVYALETWTTVPAAYIGDYTATKALITEKVISDYVISSPTDVVEFINKCIFLGNLIFYFDDIAQEIKIKYINEFDITPLSLTETDNIRDVKRELLIKDQHTRFNLAWAPYDLTKDTDEKNYQVSPTLINAEMEAPNKLGGINERKSQLFPMLTVSTDDYLLGAAAIDRITTAANVIPEVLTCNVDAELIATGDSNLIELGSVVSINTQENQDKTGQSVPVLYQAVKIDGGAFESYKVKFKRYQLYEPSDFDYVIEPGTYINYVLTDHYDPAIAGEYVVYVKTGAIFGSYDTTIAAFDTGTPNTGVTFKFIARWQVLGMGGAGQDAWRGNDTAPTAAEDGGIAFEARCNCVIDNGAGLIWAGGGGYGGGKQAQITIGDILGGGSVTNRFSSNGGGGGQGFGSSLSGRPVVASSGIDPDDPPNSYTDRGISGSITGVGETKLVGSNAGTWGMNGGYIGFNIGNIYYPELEGGLAGIAIKKNGFTVNVIAGNNDLSIKGRIV